MGSLQYSVFLMQSVADEGKESVYSFTRSLARIYRW